MIILSVILIFFLQVPCFLAIILPACQTHKFMVVEKIYVGVNQYNWNFIQEMLICEWEEAITKIASLLKTHITVLS